MKQKIKTIAVSGTNQWKDKELTKHFIQFEDMTNGTLTTGFDDTPPPVVGDELEYDIVDNGYGTEIKLPRKAGFKGGGGTKWSTEQVAQQNATNLTVAYIEGGGDIKFWKKFFVEAKEFMIVQIDKPEVKAKSLPNETEPITEKLPF